MSCNPQSHADDERDNVDWDENGFDGREDEGSCADDEECDDDDISDDEDDICDCPVCMGDEDDDPFS